MLDDVHELDEPRCIAVIEMLSADVPDRMQLAIAGRTWPARSIARLRSEGAVLEVGPKDRAMSEREISAPPDGHGAGVFPEPSVAALTRATEGWPAGVYLAALSWRDEADASAVAVTVSGDDRYLTEYFWSEFLSQRSAEEVRFLEESAVLDTMSGPLCDAVLGRVGSGGTTLHSSELGEPAPRAARPAPVLVPVSRAVPRICS